jgi:Predicted membrane protein
MQRLPVYFCGDCCHASVASYCSSYCRQSGGVVTCSSTIGLCAGAAFSIPFCFAWLRWKWTEYEISDDQIVIRSGVPNKIERIISMKKMRNFQREQTLLDRLFSMPTIIFSTFGGVATALRGVSIEDSEFLKKHITLF